jgi:tetratricopeptide (TPR) repeat protein
MFKTNLQNLLNNALELFNKKNFFEAEKIYKQILEIDNKNAEAYCALGTISAISNPGLEAYTGDVLYVENRSPISRANDQIEDVKLVIEF